MQCLRASLETQVKRNFLTMSQLVKYYTRFFLLFFFQAATLYINTICEVYQILRTTVCYDLAVKDDYAKEVLRAF